MTDEEHIDFIRGTCSQQLNHLVRSDSDLKGIVNIEVKDGGEFSIILHRGTESEATEIEGVDKEKLISLLKERL